VHELALSQQVASIVSRAATGRVVRSVQVEVGALRQVVPDALASAWQFVIAGTGLARAELQISPTPAVVACQACAAHSQLGPELGFHCRSCGSQQTTVVSGEEFRVLSIDVEQPVQPAAHEPLQ
jgi:hydrogenase nickel incorporation protein HypA/HybF